MEVLVQDQLGIVPKIFCRTAQQDATASRRRTCAEVHAGVEGVFDDSDVIDRFAEDVAKCEGESGRDGGAMAEHLGRRSLLADTEGREDPPEQIIRRELAGDFAEALLGLAQFFGHQLAGAAFHELTLRFV